MQGGPPLEENQKTQKKEKKKKIRVPITIKTAAKNKPKTRKTNGE